MVTTEPAVARARLLNPNYILAMQHAAHTHERSYLIHAESFSSIFFFFHPASRAFFVFLTGEEKRRLCLNHVKPLKSPQLKHMDLSISLSLVKPFFFFFFECVHPFIDKPMVVTDPTVASTRLLLKPGLETISSQHAAHAPQNLNRFMQSLSRAVHQNRASERTSAGTKAVSDRASAHTSER